MQKYYIIDYDLKITYLGEYNSFSEADEKAFQLSKEIFYIATEKSLRELKNSLQSVLDKS
jgi:hypothetical protein